MSFHLRSSALAIGVGDRPFVTATPPRFGGPDAPKPADKVPTPVIPGTFVSVYLAAGVTDPSTGPSCVSERSGSSARLEVWADVGSHLRRHLASLTLADMVMRAKGLQPAETNLR